MIGPVAPVRSTGPSSIGDAVRGEFDGDLGQVLVGDQAQVRVARCGVQVPSSVSDSAHARNGTRAVLAEDYVRQLVLGSEPVGESRFLLRPFPSSLPKC
jgi:hypothetical protein